MVKHGRGNEGGETDEWSGQPVPVTLPQNTVYPALLTLMHTHRLSVVDRTDASADLNGLVRFTKRQNLVSARVPSHFKRSLLELLLPSTVFVWQNFLKCSFIELIFLLSCCRYVVNVSEALNCFLSTVWHENLIITKIVGMWVQSQAARLCKLRHVLTEIM